MNTATISFLQCRLERFLDRGSLALFAIFGIRLPVTVEFSESFQAKLLANEKSIGESRKVPNICDQGIGLNGSVKKRNRCRVH